MYCAWTSTGTRSNASRRASPASTNPGRRLAARRPGQRPPAFQQRCAPRRGTRPGAIAVGNPRLARTARPDLGAAVADAIAEHRRKPVIVVEKSTVPVGTGACARTSSGAWKPRMRTGIRDRSTRTIPQGRLRRRRLPTPGPYRGRLRQRRGAPGDARTLRAVQPQPRPHAVHGPAQRRTDQVRGERHAGDQDQLHQPDRRTGRTPRCRHRGGAPGHRRRPADRLPLHYHRLRLRRLLLPQGHARADPQRREQAHCSATCCRQWKRSTDGRSTSRSNASGRSTTATCAARPSPLGPGLQAEHRRHARRAQPRTDGKRSGATARRRAYPKPCRKPSGSMATTNA